MNELQPLIDTINSFKPEWYEQYIYPVIGWITTLGAGVVLTIWGLKINEKHSIEKENLLTTNNLLLTIDTCISHLLNIKKFYVNRITNNPIQRALTIPAYNTIQNPIDFDISRMTFAVHKKNEKNQAHISNWRNLTKIRAFIENYNYLLNILEKRDQLMPEINQLLIGHKSRTPGVTLKLEEIKEKLGGLKLAYFVEITEQLILVVDHLLIEGKDFMQNFIPEIEPYLNMERLKKFNLTLLDLSNKEESLCSPIYEKCTQLDFEFASEILGRSVEDLKYNLTIN